MNIKSKLLLIWALSTLVIVVQSAPVNITVYDQNGYTGYGVGGEDKETEPGMVNKQKWDLEAFIQDGNALSLVGGYNFKYGEAGFNSGDLFFDIDGDAIYGDIHQGNNANEIVNNTFGYDYVMDLDWTTQTYDVYSLDHNSWSETTWYNLNGGSNPWRYASGGTLLASDLTIEYETGLDLPFKGKLHNRLTVDIAFLGEGTEFTAHYTMGCGNDNIIGQGQMDSVPEPATIGLMGLGLLLLGYRKRKQLK